MGKLGGKVAIVTGAGQGIGRGIALAFAKEGAKVVVAEINPETASSVEREIHELGAQVLAVVCDVSNEEQVKSMVDQVVSRFGNIDILVNNAQAMPGLMTPLESLLEKWWDEVFQTGIKATWYCCKAVFPHMKDRGGKIINFGSAAGITGIEGMAHYAANKEAIRGFSRTAAREWGEYNINVNVICPSALTPAAIAWGEQHPEERKKTREARPLGRTGDPEKDIGRTAVFVASEDADFITGQTFNVDGGLVMF